MQTTQNCKMIFAGRFPWSLIQHVLHGVWGGQAAQYPLSGAARHPHLLTLLMANFLNFHQQTCSSLLLWSCSFCQTPPLDPNSWPISSFSKISQHRGRHCILLCPRGAHLNPNAVLDSSHKSKGGTVKLGPCPKSTRSNSLEWGLGKAHLNKFPRCLGRSWAELPRIESLLHLYNFYPALKAKWTNKHFRHAYYMLNPSRVSHNQLLQWSL